MQVDCAVVKGQRQQLEVVLQGQQIADQLDGAARIHLRPQRRVRRVFALHRVVSNEFKGQFIVAHQHLCGHRQRRFQQFAVLRVSNQCRPLLQLRVGAEIVGVGADDRRLLRHGNGRKQRAVQAHLLVADRGQEPWREMKPKLHLGRRHDLGLGNRKIHRVVRIHAP